MHMMDDLNRAPSAAVAKMHAWFIIDSHQNLLHFSFFFCSAIKDSKDLKETLNAKCGNSPLLTAQAAARTILNIDVR